MKRVLPALILASLLTLMPMAALGVAKTPSKCICQTIGHNLGEYIVGCTAGATICDPLTGTYSIEDGALCCVLDLMETGVDWMFVILLVVAGLIILMGAYQFLTASGAPDKVNAARDKLVWALVGVAVAFLAKGLVRLVEMLLS